MEIEDGGSGKVGRGCVSDGCTVTITEGAGDCDGVDDGEGVCEEVAPPYERCGGSR